MKSIGRIQDILVDLGCTSNQYEIICAVYSVARMLNTAVEHPDGVLSYPGFEGNVLWRDLVRLLHETELIHDHRRFFELFAPGIVEDWDALEVLFPGRDREMLEALLAVLSCDLPRNPNPDLDLKPYYDKAVNCSLDFLRFAQCWDAICNTHLNRSGLDTNRAIMEAVALYRKPPRSLHLLLMDYAAQLPGWELSQQLQTSSKPMVERGLTEAEKAEEKILKKLFKQLPTDVIRGVFYREDRDDSAFECAYILREFKKALLVESRVLIVNPSPDFLLCWAEQVPDIHPCFVVADDIIAGMYRYQFPNYQFTSHPEGEFTHTLIMSRDSKGTLSHIPKARENSILVAVHPQNDRAPLMGALDQGGYFVRRILGIPPQATCSKPRRKMVVFAESSRMEQHFQLQFAYCDQKGEILSTQKQYDLVPYQKLYSTLTLADMRKSTRNDGKYSTKTPQQEASIYRFSKEVNLHYSIQFDRRNRVEGRACYRRILRSDDKHLKTGKTLTSLTSRGLRKKNVEEVMLALENVPLYEDFYGTIVEDVLDVYGEQPHQLSLKTAWYCLREVLSNKLTYREELAKLLFSTENQILSDLPLTSSAEVIEATVQSVFGEEVPKKYWQQLNMIFAAAVDAGWIKRNPLSDRMVAIDAKIKKRQQEVSNALTKKTLEIHEERTIVEYVRQRYKEDGSWLTGLIRLFTGMRVREVCALRWEDFTALPDLDCYRFCVSKYIADDGTEKRTIDREPEQHRFVPVDPVLSGILNDYRAFLLAQYPVTEQQLDLCPIIPHKPNALKNGICTKRCPLEHASQRCKELIKILNIPPMEILLPNGKAGNKIKNLNHYQGDIYYTNFKYRAIHSCGFLDGELCYMLGLRAADTYSRHYCDYGHDLLQYRMSRKLYRWTIQHEQMPAIQETSINRTAVQGEFYTEATSGGRELAQITCMISPHGRQRLEDMTVEIFSEFGINGSITASGG